MLQELQVPTKSIKENKGHYTERPLEDECLADWLGVYMSLCAVSQSTSWRVGLSRVLQESHDSVVTAVYCITSRTKWRATHT